MPCVTGFTGHGLGAGDPVVQIGAFAGGCEVPVLTGPDVKLVKVAIWPLSLK